MKLFFAALWVFAVAVFATPAHADVGGQVPAPGLCDYPGVGASVMVGAMATTYTYYCDFPQEINGSHWHCELAGANLGAALQANVSIAFLSIGGGVNGNLGGIGGSCSFRCPDMSMAATPNPPGAWKNYIVASKCKTIAPAPTPAGAEPPPAEDSEPVPPVGAPDDRHGPAVTNPETPNPDATQNH